jgi:hypothetical protein
VRQVAGDDARVVRAVPAGRRRIGDELQPQTHRRRRWITFESTDQRHGLATVAEQTLVHRTPPDAARRRRSERVQQTALRLPAHEGQRCPPERHISGRTPGGPAIGAFEQRQARLRIVPRSRNLVIGPAERLAALAHRRRSRSSLH